MIKWLNLVLKWSTCCSRKKDGIPDRRIVKLTSLMISHCECLLYGVYSNMDHTVACVCFLRGKIFQSIISWGSFSNTYTISNNWTEHSHISNIETRFGRQRKNYEGTFLYDEWGFLRLKPSVETSYEVSYMKVQLTRKIRLDSFNDFAENYLYEINWVSDESGFKQ